MIKALKILLALCFFVIPISGCANFSYLVNKENVTTYTVKGANFDDAFEKAVKAATQIGLSVFTSDKSTGTFYASRGNGFSEISELNFLLSREDNKTLSITLRVKSSESDKIITDFLGMYKKYVKVSAI